MKDSEQLFFSGWEDEKFVQDQINGDCVDISTIEEFSYVPEGIYFAFKKNEEGFPYLKNVKTGRIFSKRTKSQIYPTFDIPTSREITGTCKTMGLHRFFAFCFLKNDIGPKAMVHHEDNDKSNYRLNNLGWVSQSQNELAKNEQKEIDDRKEKDGQRLIDYPAEYLI